MTDQRKRILVYVLASLAVLVGFHLWSWRHGYPESGTVTIDLSGAQLILVAVGLVGVGVLIGKRWPK